MKEIITFQKKFRTAKRRSFLGGSSTTCSVEKCVRSSLTAALLNLVFAPLLAQKQSRKTAN